MFEGAGLLFLFVCIFRKKKSCLSRCTLRSHVQADSVRVCFFYEIRRWFSCRPRDLYFSILLRFEITSLRK